MPGEFPPKFRTLNGELGHYPDPGAIIVRILWLKEGFTLARKTCQIFVAPEKVFWPRLSAPKAPIAPTLLCQVALVHDVPLHSTSGFARVFASASDVDARQLAIMTRDVCKITHQGD